MTKSKGILPARAAWTAEQDAILTKRYPSEKTADIAQTLNLKIHVVYKRATTLGLKKSQAFFASAASGRTDGKRGNATRFKKGGESWNLGKKGMDFGGKETRFKPGNKPHNYMPVGSEKMADGYLWIKIADPKTWKQKHYLVWKEAHGEYPKKGFLLHFKDGNQLNIALENLEILSRQEWILRNTIQQYPTPLKELIRLSAKLKRNINEHQQS
jgi:hypothetical protein